jgi:nucleoid-associated protein YgaU
MKINFLKSAIIIPALLLFATACDLDVPVREMVDAKMAIEEGHKYKADKYSPDELKQAETALFKSNELLKDEKADDAKKSAIEAQELAQKALDKTLPLYSADMLESADKTVLEAEKLFAERFSPENFSSAKENLSLAREEHGKPDYKKSIELSSSALAFADMAKADSLKNSDEIKNEIDSLRTKLAALKESPISDSAGDEIREADDEISKADDNMAENNLRGTVAATDAARENITAAERIIEANTIYGEISRLRKEINSAITAEKNDAIRNDLDKASLALNRAETLIEEPDFPAARTAVAEAEKLLAGSKIKAKEILLQDRINNAREELKTAENMDKEFAHEKNLAIAGSLLNESETELKAARYDKSEDALDEAETMIAAIKNSIEIAAKEKENQVETAAEEKKESEETVEKKTEPEENIYVVQWRKKDTDCLWRISLKVYNDASFWPAIYIANKDQIKDPDLIFPGQKFKIPPKPEKRPEYKPERDREGVKQDN